MEQIQGHYTPYLALAEAVVDADSSPELFLHSLFPEASETQLAYFILYTIGKFHDGIMLGLEVAGRDPIDEVSAYQIGVQDGLDYGQKS